MRTIVSRNILKLALTTAAVWLPSTAQAQVPCLPGSDVLCLDQGKSWSNATRKRFYSQDQGSQLMPLAWIKALQTADGKPFLYDALARYGYLPDSFRIGDLPVGFTATKGPNVMVGMTCAACHTRQISRDGFSYRVDGGPAIVDFQAFLTDLIESVGRVRANETQFTAFATQVLGAGASQGKIASLRTEIDIWFERENTLRERAYAKPGLWGLGRLDAVAMIFNRLTGLDLGPPPTYLIPANIQPADAPVRYPFLWNASRQDLTQWPGFSGNGSAVMGLARNTGEVFGVFATLHPVSPSSWPGNVNFVAKNSADWAGLRELERLIRKLGAPKWPAQFPRTEALVARGAQVYQAACAMCHATGPIPPGKPGFPNIPTWQTPLQDVGTDSREYDILKRTADPGVLINMKSDLFPKFKVANPSPAFDLLKYSVLAAMLQSGAILPAFAEDLIASIGSKKGATADKARQAVEDAMVIPAGGDFKYESRVLFGIWAAAPYLHNGSVPTLTDLLLPAAERPASFAVGPNYDAVRLGMAKSQPGSYVQTTTGCEDRNSGNSRCGHEFGTDLPSADKRALLEYLKTL